MFYKPELPITSNETTGYFIIYIDSKEIVKGLSQESFEVLLAEQSIREYELKAPTSLYRGSLSAVD